MTLPADLQRAVDAGELVFPVDVEGDGATGEETRNQRGRLCPRRPGSVTDQWDDPRGNPPVPHRATDIFSALGTYCYAIESGVVERVPNADGGPFALRLRGRRGVWYYSHMMDGAPSGARVVAGDVIGRLGREGNARRLCPHLHFGWRAPRAAGAGGRQLNATELLQALERRAREGEDSEGPTVDGDQDERDRLLMVLSEEGARAEALLLDVADQWEDTGDRNAVYVASQFRDMVRNARARYWRVDPARTLRMLEGAHSEALRIWHEHPEWFEERSILNSIRRALQTAKEALLAAGAAAAQAGQGFGFAGLGLVLVLAFMASGGSQPRRVSR